MGKMGAGRVWMGWLAFDVEICKYEIDVWCEACDLDVRDRVSAKFEVPRVDGVVRTMLSEKNC